MCTIHLSKKSILFAQVFYSKVYVIPIYFGRIQLLLRVRNTNYTFRNFLHS